MEPMGVFADGELICLAMPALDQVREFRRYDIGAIFSLETEKEEKAVDLIWKYAIDLCLKNNAVMGNANADSDEAEDPLEVTVSERIGLVKIARNCGYHR